MGPRRAVECDAAGELFTHATRILTIAAAPPSLRSATFAMLARLDGVSAGPERRTGDGRRAVSIVIDMPSNRLAAGTGEVVLVFDPDTSEVVETAGSRTASGRSVEKATRGRMTIEASAQVSRIGERP